MPEMPPQGLRDGVGLLHLGPHGHQLCLHKHSRHGVCSVGTRYSVALFLLRCFAGSPVHRRSSAALNLPTLPTQGMLFWAFNGLGLGLLLPNAQSLIADYFSGAGTAAAAAIFTAFLLACQQQAACCQTDSTQPELTLHFLLPPLQPSAVARLLALSTSPAPSGACWGRSLQPTWATRAPGAWRAGE